MKYERVLVTGGSGFIGTNLIQHHLDRGRAVLNLDVKPPQNSDHSTHWTRCDIRSRTEFVEHVVAFEPDLVLHMAARTDLAENRDLEGYSANMAGVEHLVEAVNAAGSVLRLIVASSRMVCRIGYIPTDEEDYCPPNLYGQSKVETERIMRSATLATEWILVRPTSIWGPWFDIPYRTFFNTIARRVYVHPGSADPKKSFGFVGNTVHQLSRLSEAPADDVDRRTFYLCDYPPLRLSHWADLVRTEMGLPPIRRVPMAILRTAAIAGDFMSKAGWYGVPLTSFRLDNLITEMVHEVPELEKIAGDLPFSLEEGVRRTVAWMHRDRPASGA